ncbi:GNAT family N-acetyltransferase [Chitinophaga sp. RAB17]|uniref:GNAT family N-acetyltransferase n=1 Tax=Chitinophaga sp. RAB17 TaxID=3233049 RepID=UPI003F8FEDA1
MEKKKISLKPVDTKNWKDFDTLFQGKGGPKYCWCMVWRATKEELKHNNPESKRGFMKDRVKQEIPIGLLAYQQEEPVAWCSIAPRETYQRLGGDDTLEKVWSLACFFIKKDYRSQGLVEKLIAGAKKYAKKNGGKYLEAYPVETDSPSYKFMGFVPSFEKAGFSFVKKAGTRRHVMTCKL